MALYLCTILHYTLYLRYTNARLTNSSVTNLLDISDGQQSKTIYLNKL